jgi:hypothetical protein
MTVWRLADGKRSVEQIAHLSKLDPAIVPAALYALAQVDLLLSSDINAVVYRDHLLQEGDVPLVCTHRDGAVWLAGYRRARAEKSDPPSAGTSYGSPWDKTLEAS